MPDNGNGAQPRAKRKQEFYTYSTGRPAAGLATGASATFQILIQADADFAVEKLTFSADIAGAAQTSSSAVIPNVTVLITATGSGMQFMNTPLPLSGLFGTGQLPFILPFPRMLPANSQVQFQVVSFEAASVPFITFNMIGRKVYLIGNPV